MTALADSPTARHGQGSYRGPSGAGTGPAAVSGLVLAADRSGTVRDRSKAVRSWPLVLLAFPAAAEVWSGWVGIAQKTGFGQVSPLPGIWSSLHLDTTITLPVGFEAGPQAGLGHPAVPAAGRRLGARHEPRRQPRLRPGRPQ
jgi:hypothetical protein